MKPDLLDLRALWALYADGEWIAVAILCERWSAALWDLNGVSCNCEFAQGK